MSKGGETVSYISNYSLIRRLTRNGIYEQKDSLNGGSLLLSNPDFPLVL